MKFTIDIIIIELTLHIRAVGEWTNRLYDHFDHAKTLTLKKMLEEWKCLDFHPLFKNTDQINKFDVNCDHALDHKVHNVGNSLQKRTMILPVPEDCDEDGCGKIKKQISIENSDNESESGSGMVTIELNQISPKSASETNVSVNHIQKPLALLKNIHKDVQTNAVFLKSPLKIHLDGPYGAPSSNIFESEHAVLVATGIGVTPFASILQSIMYRHIEKTRHCPLCKHSWTERVPSRHINNLKKVDFIWINRNQTSFEWFVEMLSDLVEQQSTISIKDDRFFDIHMYVTNKDGEKSSYSDQWTKGSSIIDRSNSMINWRFGRPEWDGIFQNIRQQKRGKVTFFYCGRPDLSGYLRQKCSENDFVFKKEVF